MWYFNFFLILSSLWAHSLHASWYGKSEEGWLWYKRIETTPKNQKESPLPPGQPLSASEKIKKQQQRFEEATAKAILNPTLKNVQYVQALQQQIINSASTFAEVWMLASLFNNQHYNLQDNPNPLHRSLYKRYEEDWLEQKIKTMAKEWGLFFAYKSNCIFCHKFAPIVKAFAGTYGFQVKAISRDGGRLDLFPDALIDNGTLDQINPEHHYPALYLAHPSTMRVIPLSVGLVSESDLKENIKVIITGLKGDRP